MTVTRLAPTPSGFLHIGNILSFSITAALAAEYGAKIILRIDDMDRDRVDEDYLEDIFETLAFLGISWDEGPRDLATFQRSWSQLGRMDLYRSALQELAAGGHVFACNCSRTSIARESGDGGYPGTCRKKGIPLDESGVSWRLRTEGLAPSVRDFIVRKKDGMPAYQLSSLVDDLHYGIDLIVRGEDLRASTRAQLFLSQFITGGEAFRRAVIVHHPLLAGDDGQKLSKSAGATSIRFLRQQGRTREEIYRMIGMLLGAEGVVYDNLSLGVAAIAAFKIG